MGPIKEFEIDFLPVGNGDRSGDAIAVRWFEGDIARVLVYDGGTKESGEALVGHITRHYATNHVDYLVNSHPDADHASGLSVVLEKLTVGEVWMHLPWTYSSVIRDYFHDGRITDESLASRLKEKMAAAHEVEQLARRKGVPVYEPFQGMQIGPFRVLSPEADWYVHELVPAFEKSPELKKATAVESNNWLMRIAAESARKATDWVAERWAWESLKEDVTTSAENLSSVVLYADLDGKGILLTGDSGVESLKRAAAYARLLGIDLPSKLAFVQVPHHGSRNNVSTSVLDQILGPRKPSDDGVYTKTAFVSAGKESTTHPRRMVTNAFFRRGAEVIATKGTTQTLFHGIRMRDGWVPSTPMTFSESVESWD